MQLLTLCPRTQDSQAHFSPSIIILNDFCVFEVLARAKRDGAFENAIEAKFASRGEVSLVGVLLCCAAMSRVANCLGWGLDGTCSCVGHGQMTMDSRRGLEAGIECRIGVCQR